jgi:hypothetical protein
MRNVSRAVVQRLGLLMVGLVVGLGLCEALLRLTLDRVEPVYGDFEVGFSARPHRELDYPFEEHPGGHYIIHWNNLGLRRDADTAVEKPAGMCRVLVLGDSHTHCTCSNAESYATIAERTLDAIEPGVQHEVLNAGHGFYSPYQYYRLLQYRLAELAPDAVVVGFYVGNDLLDLLRDEDRPSLSQLPDGQIVEVAPWFVTYEPPAARDSLRIHSQLYLRLSQAYSSLVGITLSRAWMIYEGVRGEGYGPADVLSYVRDFNKVKHLHGGAVAQSVGQQLYFQHFPHQLETAWRLNAAVLDRFAAFAAAHRTPVVFAPIPTKLGIEPGDVGPLVDALAAALPSLSPERLRDTDDAYYERLLRQLEKRGLPVLDLRPALRAAAADDRVFYRSDFHLNLRGNAVMGRALAEWLDAHRAELLPACHATESERL